MLPWFQFDTVMLGPVPIRLWGFFVSLGIVVACLGIWRRAKRAGLPPDHLMDWALWVVIAGFIGARAVHVMAYEPAFYFFRPWEIFKIWNGGWSSFGGLFGAVVGFFLFARRHGVRARAELLRVGDIMGVSALAGWLVGRLGCVLIHDHLGTPCNCFFDFDTPTGPKLDLALLEIIGLLPLAFAFVFLKKKQLRPGIATAGIAVYYSALRLLLDFLRTGDSRYFGLTPAQFFAILLLIFSGHALLKNYWKGRIAA